MEKHWTGAVKLPLSPSLLAATEARLEGEGRRFAWESVKPGSRFGYLWIGSIPKDKRPRCGAKTRKGTPCKARALDWSERCKLHGGASTGPKTQEGRARIAESNRRRAEQRRAQKSGASG